MPTSDPNAVVFLRLSERAIIPKRCTKDAAGLDLFAENFAVISPQERKFIGTGIQIRQFPAGCYARVASRSSVSLSGIDVGAGVIDPDFSGEVKVLLVNFTASYVEIMPGQRIAQLVFEKFAVPEIFEETVFGDRLKVDCHSNVVRGENGFGSTGS